jgi:hypothetical protein
MKINAVIFGLAGVLWIIAGYMLMGIICIVVGIMIVGNEVNK